ncbi:MAG: hypothetical protein MJZ38_05245, partial [archaeon]|nr:hypothetical protein [archaeon]
MVRNTPEMAAWQAFCRTAGEYLGGGVTATPTNSEGADYFGGLGYSITTSDGSLASTTWNSYADVPKEGALLTYYGSADAAASYGGFNVVTSAYGNGAAAMTTAYLHNGSTGALVSMIVRLLSEDSSKTA